MLETVVQPSPKKVSSLKKLFKKCKEQKELVLLSIPFVIYALIFIMLLLVAG